MGGAVDRRRWAATGGEEKAGGGRRRSGRRGVRVGKAQDAAHMGLGLRRHEVWRRRFAAPQLVAPQPGPTRSHIGRGQSLRRHGAWRRKKDQICTYFLQGVICENKLRQGLWWGCGAEVEELKLANLSSGGFASPQHVHDGAPRVNFAL